MAAVFCASFSRSAMRLRRRLMRTRSSRAPSWRGGAGGAGGWGAAGAGGRRRSRSGRRRRDSWPGAPPGISARPPWSAGRPCRWRGWMLRPACSLRSACARPATAAPLRLPVRAPLPGPGCACGAAGAAAGFAAGAAFAVPAPSPITPSTAPTSTVWPSATRISDSTPAEGANTSSVTLSVSSSTSASSAAMLSPCCFIHFATVASVTDSPRAGTTILLLMAEILSSDSGGRFCRLISARNYETVRASLTSLSCSLRCRRSRPVAGEAAATRPT